MAAFILQGCHTSIPQKEKSSQFDIPRFIKQETNRLQEQNPTVLKSVTIDKSSESKELKIANWDKELAQFSNTDLNKAGSMDFRKETKEDTLIYTSQSSTSNKVIVKVIPNKETISYLAIYKQTKNLLFENSENLIYTPGKHYSITKKQSVKGLGTNTYSITGKF